MLATIGSRELRCSVLSRSPLGLRPLTRTKQLTCARGHTHGLATPNTFLPPAAHPAPRCRFIHASRPGQSHTFRLVTAFPAQQLDDDSATIQGAGLANSVIIQK